MPLQLLPLLLILSLLLLAAGRSWGSKGRWGGGGGITRGSGQAARCCGAVGGTEEGGAPEPSGTRIPHRPPAARLDHARSGQGRALPRPRRRGRRVRHRGAWDPRRCCCACACRCWRPGPLRGVLARPARALAALQLRLRNGSLAVHLQVRAVGR